MDVYSTTCCMNHDFMKVLFFTVNGTPVKPLKRVQMTYTVGKSSSVHKKLHKQENICNRPHVLINYYYYNYIALSVKNKNPFSCNNNNKKK